MSRTTALTEAPDTAFPAERWVELGEVLRREDGVLVRGADRRVFLHRHEQIALRERDLDDRLFLGLVGGTGVGKSTLINAIAGGVISRSGDRRPTTDRAVVYRHEDTPLPQTFPRVDLATPERTHTLEDMLKLIILDFPDFDSVEADHAAILQRALPSLDITFVLVDETKYGDRRLYEMLRTFPQSPKNLYLVLNKRDELEARYGGAAGDVVSDLLGDLRRKVETYVGWSPADDQLLAISALDALRHRAEGEGEGEGSPPPPGAGFEQVLGLLDGYRAAKRRLAVKRENLDHLKLALGRDVREVYLDPRRVQLGRRVRRRLERGNAEADAVLEGLSQEVLGPLERGALRAATLRKARSRLGFPMDLIFTAFGELRFRRRSVTRQPARLGERVVTHYRPVQELLEVLEKSLRAEFGQEYADLVPRRPSLAAGSDEHSLLSAGDVQGEHSRELESLLERRLRRPFLRNHALPGLAVLLFLWTLVHPVLLELAEGLRDGAESFEWSTFFGNVIVSFITALNPVYLGGLLILFVALYGLSAVILWSRLAQAVETAVARTEERSRERVRGAVAEFRQRALAILDRWEDEWAELESILGVAEGPPGSGSVPRS